jgi:hypothetical protein
MPTRPASAAVRALFAALFSLVTATIPASVPMASVAEAAGQDVSQQFCPTCGSNAAPSGPVPVLGGPPTNVFVDVFPAPKLNATLTIHPASVNVRIGGRQGSVANTSYVLTIANPSDQPWTASGVHVFVPKTLFPDRPAILQPNPVLAQSFNFVVGTNGFDCHIQEPYWGALSSSNGFASCDSGSIAPGQTATVWLSGQIDGSLLDASDLGIRRQQVYLTWQNEAATASASSEIAIVEQH